MSDQEVVFVVPVNVTRSQLVDNIIRILNRYELCEEEPLTIEEILSKPELLKYLCTESVKDGIALYDPYEFWSNDGWCNVRDYR